MHAAVLHAFGPATQLRYEQTPDPVPGEGQVRIAVAAAGVHLVDATLRSGEAGGPFVLPELPAVLGREVAGTVDAVGTGTDASWLGKRVVTRLGNANGGYAELAVADAGALHVIPDELDFDTAVAVIGTGSTALGILEAAEITAADTVLVTAAAGGIGSLLVRAAKQAGATVIGLASTAKLGQVTALGADQAIDYTVPGWEETAGKVTVVLDGVGGAAGTSAMNLLAPRGRLVVFGWSSGEPLSVTTDDLYRLGISATAALGLRALSRPGGLKVLGEDVLKLAAAGELVPHIGQAYPLAEAATAHADLESRTTTGKVILRP